MPTPFPQKDIDNYILNAIITTAQIDSPFNFNEVVEKVKGTLPKPPLVASNTFEAHVYVQLMVMSIHGDSAFRQLNLALTEGYIKKLQDGTNRYILSEKGELVKMAGGIKAYNIKKWRKDFIKIFKEVVLGMIPIITLFILFYQACNKEVEINKPIKVIIDTSSFKNQIEIINPKRNQPDTSNEQTDSLIYNKP